MLNTDQQLDKLNKFDKLAVESIGSEDIIKQLGAFTIYAGMADFFAIQSARLLEQVVLKTQLAERKTPTFYPHEDIYFYNAHVSTRKILREIQKFLPFQAHSISNPMNTERVEKINEAAKKYIDKAFRFLNYRNLLIHHIGNPKKSSEEIEELIHKGLEAYQEMVAAHRVFFELAYPYRFSQKEIDYFYAK